MTRPFSHGFFRRGAGGLLCLALVLLLFVPTEAQAQRWLKTTQMIAPVEADTPTRALLDTLVSVIDRTDSLMVKRSPDATEKLPVESLREMLINQEGIGLTSANQVFINHRFEVDRDGFTERVTELFFVYRPPSAGEEDIPIMYLNATSDWVRRTLTENGTTLASNEAAMMPFSDQLAFVRLLRGQNVQIVQVGNRTVREGFGTKERNLIDQITQLSYSSD